MKYTKLEIKDALVTAVVEATGKEINTCRTMAASGAILLNYLGDGDYKAIGSVSQIKISKDINGKIDDRWSLDKNAAGETLGFEHYFIIKNVKTREIIDFYGYRRHFAERWGLDFDYEPDPLWCDASEIPDRYRKFWLDEDIRRSWTMNPACAPDLGKRCEISAWQWEMAGIAEMALKKLGALLPDEWARRAIRASFRPIPGNVEMMSLYGAKPLF
jgi:hypothetical protein